MRGEFYVPKVKSQTQKNIDSINSMLKTAYNKFIDTIDYNKWWKKNVAEITGNGKLEVTKSKSGAYIIRNTKENRKNIARVKATQTKLKQTQIKRRNEIKRLNEKREQTNIMNSKMDYLYMISRGEIEIPNIDFYDTNKTYHSGTMINKDVDKLFTNGRNSNIDVDKLYSEVEEFEKAYEEWIKKNALKDNSETGIDKKVLDDILRT